MTAFTLDTLRALMRSCVGVEEGIDLDGPIGAVPFVDLGYDSLALLELVGQIRRRYGVDVPDEALTDLMPTPDAAVSYVNRAFGTMVGV